MLYLTADEIRHIFERLVAEYADSPWPIVPPIVLDQNGLVAAAERPKAGFGDVEVFPTVFEKAAALAHSIITTHPFGNGNKRTGMIAAEQFLELNGYKVGLSNEEWADLALDIANHRADVPEIAERLKKASRPIGTE